MKRSLILFILLFCALGNGLPANDHVEVASSLTVNSIFTSVPEKYFETETFTAFMLEDGSVWKVVKENFIARDVLPKEGDSIINSNGTSFFNLTRGGLFFAENLGHATKQPLSLDKVYSHSLFESIEHFLSNLVYAEFSSAPGFDTNIHLNYLNLSNGLYYSTPEAPMSFDEWKEGESILLVRSDTKETDCDDSYEILINLERGEIRMVNTEEYASDRINYIDNLSFAFEQLEGLWQIDPSQSELLAIWTYQDPVRIFSTTLNFCDVSDIDPEFLFMLKMILGEEIIDALQGWEISLGLVLNLSNDTTIFCWKWTDHNDFCIPLEPPSVWKKKKSSSLIKRCFKKQSFRFGYN